MPDDEIRFLGDMVRLQPQPGDVFVLTCEQFLSESMLDRIRAQWESVMGKSVRLIVLQGGMKLGAVSATAA